MTVGDILRFQFGAADAIRAVAASRAALPTGVILVLLTAVARSYDQTWIGENPFLWLFGPLLFSLVSGTWLFWIVYAGFVRASGLAEVQYTVLTPFPGTPLHARLRREGRLLAERFWDRCTLFDVNHRPARMSVEDLEAGLRWLMRETYAREETVRRAKSFVAQRRPDGDRAAAALRR